MNTSPLYQHSIQETPLFSLIMEVMHQGLFQKNDMENCSLYQSKIKTNGQKHVLYPKLSSYARYN